MIHFNVSVKQIEWLDSENTEAEVLVEIRGKEIWAFCHPCNLTVGQIPAVDLHFIEGEVSDWAFWNENKEGQLQIEASTEKRWSYYCHGKIIELHPVTIDCGAITLEYGDWINDEQVIGKFVYFVIDRLDVKRILP